MENKFNPSFTLNDDDFEYMAHCDIIWTIGLDDKSGKCYEGKLLEGLT
jgi:hypothetical protein